MLESSGPKESAGGERVPWSVLVLVQHTQIAEPLIRVLSAYQNGREVFDIQYLKSQEEQRWALHHLRTGQQFPHLVLFDAFNVAMQPPLLLALRDFPEVGKVLIGDGIQAEVLKLTIDTCGVDVVVEPPMVPRQLFQLVERLRSMWTGDGLIPLRLAVSDLTHQITALNAQNQALARANARTIDALADFDNQTRRLEQKEQIFQQSTRMLAKDNLAAGGVLSQGSLSEYPLLQLLRVASMAQFSVKIVLIQGGQKATIYMWDGMILHAEGGRAVGSFAIQKLLHWEWGEYFLQPLDAPSERTIFIETDDLLYQEEITNGSHEKSVSL